MPSKPISRRSFLTISAMTAAALALDWSKISAYAAKMGPKTDYPTVVIRRRIGRSGLRGLSGQTGNSGYRGGAAQHSGRLRHLI